MGIWTHMRHAYERSAVHVIYFMDSSMICYAKVCYHMHVIYCRIQMLCCITLMQRLFGFCVVFWSLLR